MINLNWVTLFLLLISCKSNNKFEVPKKEIIENQIIFKTGKELEKEKQLTLVGFGGSSLKEFGHIAVSFDYFHPLNMEKARELIIYTSSQLLKNLNNNESLRDPQIGAYEVKNIKIMIFCYMPNKSSAKPPNLGSVWLIKNKIYYNLREENIKTIHEETYEEALKIVKIEKNN